MRHPTGVVFVKGRKNRIANEKTVPFRLPGNETVHQALHRRYQNDRRAIIIKRHDERRLMNQGHVTSAI